MTIKQVTYRACRHTPKFLPLTIVSIIASLLAAQSQKCPTITPPNETKLVDYVKKRYSIPASVTLKLKGETPIAGTCFRKLAFHGKTDLKEWDLLLYISPDSRFLFSDLLDTQVDPVDEQRQKASELMAGLAENKSSSRGSASASVTIVEFSDFECPYCKQFAAFLREAVPLADEDVRIVFHHMPLAMHPWARRAAEGAACAQLQSAQAFWDVHDGLFAAQAEITVANIDDKLKAIAESSRIIDPVSFKACLDSEMSLGLVYRDMNLASSHAVNATPTLYINGRRSSGFKDITSLKKAISDARDEARSRRFESTKVSGVHGALLH